MTKNIQTNNHQFIDKEGRELLLRGINLAGSSKIPFSPRVPSHVRENFFSKQVSFIGRPFPLEEAERHFQRLKEWGFRFLRLLVTWEAVEHDGPGIYDEAYIEYIYQIAKKAGDFGLDLFIDPHQDVWSRFTGGDGAPLWTLELAGFEPARFHETLAAMVHNLHGDPFPRMIWPANYNKLACATMFTLFWAGHDFAPGAKIDGQYFSDFLQDHYIRAMGKIAESVKDLPNVVGFDTMNEPSAGFIGVEDLARDPDFFKIGPCPTPFQSMLLGEGIPQSVKTFQFEEITDEKLLNQERIRAWQDGKTCLWKKHGVWEVENGQPVLKKPGYFSQVNGQKVNFLHDYFKPFVRKFAAEIQKYHPGYLIFMETAVENRQLPQASDEDPDMLVNADHWYDEFTLITKTFSKDKVYQHRKKKWLHTARDIEDEFISELAGIKAQGEQYGKGIPTLIGEFGIPFDLNERKAYTNQDYSEQIMALDRSFRALDHNLLSGTLWNYTPDNDNERGDQWNGEDLSIYYLNHLENGGGRAVRGFARPYPYRVGGSIQTYYYNLEKGRFLLSFDASGHPAKESWIIIPPAAFPEGFEVNLSDGHYKLKPEEQLLVYFPSEEVSSHRIEIISK